MPTWKMMHRKWNIAGIPTGGAVPKFLRPIMNDPFHGRPVSSHMKQECVPTLSCFFVDVVGTPLFEFVPQELDQPKFAATNSQLTR